MGAGLVYTLYQNDFLQPLPPTKSRAQLAAERQRKRAIEEKKEAAAAENVEELAALPFSQAAPPSKGDDTSAWGTFSAKFESFTSIKDVDWPTIQENLADFMRPDWAKNLPENLSRLQRELSMAPGSLADEIWKDAQNPENNPEIIRKASVRVSQELCDEEKEFRRARRVVTTRALAKYLGIPEEEVNPDDVPTIAMVGSGGGLRALVAGTGSLFAAHEAGLFQCVTYTAGVSGSCWLQALYHSSLGGRRFDKMVNHLKARLGTHIAYPPVAFEELNSAPTNKFLLSGFVEKLKGDPNADFGIVDLYGLLLAARLLVPKGELGVDNRDLKISSQRANLKDGGHPMPIYTAVRHEIPIIEKLSPDEKATEKLSEEVKEKTKKEARFQWFEISPYEMFCEEFSAGIPTWAMGRKFKGGEDIPQENGLRVPELKLPLLLGAFGSAMCATLSHYAREIRPIVKGILPPNGFNAIEEMMEERDDELSKVHPINPASIPNFCFGMEGRLPKTAPESIVKGDHLQLMDAGMSNNLPMYSCLRPGRDIDIVIAFDASADIKTENWLQVTEGYALQRGIKGWPIGAGWPRPTDTPEKAAADLHKAEISTVSETEDKLKEAKADDEKHVKEVDKVKSAEEHESLDAPKEDDGDLGYCSVWVGTTQEREHTDPRTTPRSKSVAEDWQLMEPDAGIAIVYFPYVANAKVAGVDPVTSPYMSTWNFVYTPEDVDNVVALAKANFEEGREQTRRVVRAVYERKKKLREGREQAEKREMFRRMLRLEALGKKGGDDGHGDHIS
jgi:phospholipase A2